MTTDRQTKPESSAEYRSPGREECLEALAEYKTPENVIGHCKAVAAVGCKLAEAFNEKGSRLDLDLILAAGLLHDIARVEEDHWDVGADYCLSRGWTKEADIVRAHMKYDPFNPVEDFNETDIVCLADRLVLEDRYAGLEKRIEYIIAKAKRHGHEDHVPIIQRKKEETAQLIKRIEYHLGRSLDDIMSDLNYD